MDPVATLRAIEAAIEDEDYDEAELLAAELQRWQLRGGFMPADVVSRLLPILGKLDAAEDLESRDAYGAIDRLVAEFRRRLWAPAA